jgi:hypothetical protein
MADFVLEGRRYKSQQAYIETGQRCGTPHVGYYQIRKIDEIARRFREASDLNAGFRKASGTVTINIQFIHIVDGKEGEVTPSQRADQVRVLNDDYRPHHIQFAYSEEATKVIDNGEWFRMGHLSAAERRAKAALQTAPETNLNFYSAGFPVDSTLLGWATFPYELSGDRVRDGVVLRHGTLPGGSADPYNRGRTATHEVGHWLGLYHTFQGGCDAVGDHVDDTAAHSGPNYGTPEIGESHNACNSSHDAPVQNFMNYTDDAWMTHFTDRQGARMREQIAVFRPDLLIGNKEEIGRFNRISTIG